MPKKFFNGLRRRFRTFAVGIQNHIRIQNQIVDLLAGRQYRSVSVTDIAPLERNRFTVIVHLGHNDPGILIAAGQIDKYKPSYKNAYKYKKNYEYNYELLPVIRPKFSFLFFLFFLPELREIYNVSPSCCTIVYLS